MSNSIATISIPISDSSPRSVYESIFSGAPTILQDNPYQDFMTDSMKSRVITINITDMKNSHWLSKSIKEARNEINTILTKLEKQETNLDESIGDYQRLIHLNKHIDQLFKEKFKEFSKKNIND